MLSIINLIFDGGNPLLIIGFVDLPRYIYTFNESNIIYDLVNWEFILYIYIEIHILEVYVHIYGRTGMQIKLNYIVDTKFRFLRNR